MNGSNGSDSNDGFSWSAAKLSIKNATGTVTTGGTVNIANGVYSGEDNTNISINKNMNIAGANPTNTKINGQESTIFTIANGVNITIQDITLTNSSTAIYNRGNLTLINTTLTSNTASSRAGGAIYNTGTLNITNSKITDNQGSSNNYGLNWDEYYPTVYFLDGGDGGAIYNTGYITITNTTLTNNTAGNGDNGMAYYMNGAAVIDGSNGGSGGAIYNTGHLTIINTNLNSNQAGNGGSGSQQLGGNGGDGGSGGAIYNTGNLKITNTNLNSNQAGNSGDAGTDGSNSGNPGLIGNGGAVFNSNTGTITDVNTINMNNLAYYGGAICNTGNLTDTNGTYMNNTAVTGGAIFNYGHNLKSKNCKYTNNTAFLNGGAIYNDINGYLNVSICSFTGNNATNSGGAIYNAGNASVNFSQIVGNKASQGSGICQNTGSLNADYNWWGFNTSPSGRIYGATVNKWIVLNVTANPAIIKANGTSTITAYLTHDNAGVYHNPSYGHVPDGIPVIFTTNLGTINSPVTTVNGIAKSTFKAGLTGGIATVSAKMDNQTVNTSVTIDVTLPTVKSVDPANKAVNILANKTIKITFSEAIKSGNMWIELKNSNGTAISFNETISGNILTIKPTSPLAENKYTLTLHSGSITDLAGNPLALYASSFSVGTSPTVKTIDPINSTINIPVNKTIKITFNEPIKAGSNYIELKSSTGTVIPITSSISGNILTINHALLTKGTKYTLTLHSGSITDLAGNPLALWGSSFTTTTV